MWSNPLISECCIEIEKDQVPATLSGTINVSVLISGCSIVMECWLHQKVHDNDKHADASVRFFG
jgi:hypothetical protein